MWILIFDFLGNKRNNGHVEVKGKGVVRAEGPN